MKNILVVSLLFLVACSPSKKLEKLQEKHPDLFYNVVDSVTVTVYEVDTITIDTQVFITNDVIINCDEVVSNSKPIVITKEDSTHTSVFEITKNRNGNLNIDTKTIVKPQTFTVRDTVLMPVTIEKNCPKHKDGAKWYHFLGWILFCITLLLWLIQYGKINFNIFNPK
jgi:hypothetical protein